MNFKVRTVCKRNTSVKQTPDPVVARYLSLPPVLYHLHGQTSRFTIWANLVSKFRTGKFRPGIVLNICTNQKWNTNFRSEHSHWDKQPPTFKPTLQLFPPIDLFTDTAAILNLLDLRIIMGCPGGTRSVFTRAFWAKRDLHCIFLGKKAIIITSKHGTTIFFSHYNLFLGKLNEKLGRKARLNTERVYRIVLIPPPPRHPIILLKSK